MTELFVATKITDKVKSKMGLLAKNGDLLMDDKEPGYFTLLVLYKNENECIWLNTLQGNVKVYNEIPLKVSKLISNPYDFYKEYMTSDESPFIYSIELDFIVHKKLIQEYIPDLNNYSKDNFIFKLEYDGDNFNIYTINKNNSYDVNEYFKLEIKGSRMYK